MEKKSKITAMLSVLLVSAPTTAKKITTSNLRDNAMRTTAVEVDGENNILKYQKAKMNLMLSYWIQVN